MNPIIIRLFILLYLIFSDKLHKDKLFPIAEYSIKNTNYRSSNKSKKNDYPAEYPKTTKYKL